MSATGSVIARAHDHRERPRGEGGPHVVRRGVAALGEDRAVEPRGERGHQLEVRPRGRRARAGVAAQGRGDRVGAGLPGPHARLQRVDVGQDRRVQLGAQPRQERAGPDAAGALAERRVDRDDRRPGRRDRAGVLERRRDVHVAARHAALAQADDRRAGGPHDGRDVLAPLGAQAARPARDRRPRHGRHVDGRPQRAAGRRLAGDHETAAERLERHARTYTSGGSVARGVAIEAERGV